MSEFPSGRRLGLIGGIGVGAAVHYYEELAKAHEARGRTLDLLMVHADVRRVLGHVGAGEILGLARYLAALIDRLKAGGAEVAAIAAVTPHICMADLIAISPLPLVNLLELVGEEARARGIRRAALFGTRFVIESGLFGQLPGVELVMPRPDEVAFIHDTYLQVAASGSVTDAQHRGLTAIAHTLCGRDGAEAIVFAGTDLSLLFNKANTDFPHLDCSRLHIRAITGALLDEER